MKDQGKSKKQLINELVEATPVDELKAKKGERKRARDTIQHLNAVLSAIRNVNQLIVREKDRDRLFKGICDTLIETHGYYNVWIVLFDETEKLVTTAESSLGEGFLPVLNRLNRGEFPACCRKALMQSEVVVTEDPFSTCTDCPLVEKYEGRGGMTVRLEYNGRVYGTLTVSIPRDVTSNEEEHSLFKELAADMGFALHSIELEDERNRIEEALREAHDELEMLVDERTAELVKANEHLLLKIEEHKQAEGCYRLLAENLTDVIWTMDMNMKFTYFSPSIERLTGYSVKESMAQSIEDSMTSASFDKTMNVFTQELELHNKMQSDPDRSVLLELELTCKDASTVWTELQVNFLYGPDGQPTGVIGTIRNITERKLAEEALRESEARFRDIAANALKWIWEIDASGKYTYASPIVEQILGYTHEQVLGKHFYDFFHPEEREKLKKEAFEAFAQRESLREYINRNVHKNGQTVWLSTNGVPVIDKKGDFLGYRGADTNITNRKWAEDALRESEKKYRNILESMEEGYAEIDLKGNFTFFNGSLIRILGYSREELMGMNNREYSTHESAEKMYQIFNRVYVTGKTADISEYEVIKKDGSIKYLEFSVFLMKDQEGRPTGFRGIARDVTKRLKARKERRELENQLHNAKAATIMGLAKLAEYRDKGTGSHLERIGEYTKIIAKELAGLPAYKDYITEKYIDDIYKSSILHDIGKVGIRDSVLLKPGKLNPEEFDIMKRHTILGGDALTAIESQTEGRSFLTLGKEIAYYHHEKWDGTGYPDGRKGEDIPLSARIVAIADVYDALTTKRFYKEAFTHEKSREIIIGLKGSHFDPDVVDAFLANEKKFSRICAENRTEEMTLPEQHEQAYSQQY